MSFIEKLRQHVSLAVIAVLLIASIAPALINRKASAYGLVSERYVKMSSSASGATTLGQDVTYQVGFKPATTTTIGGIVVQFCTNSPIIGDTCNPASAAGFDTNFATLAIANQVTLAGFTVDTTNSTSDIVIITNATPQSLTAGTALSFDLGSTGGSDGLTNPSTTNTTFYARILTYDTDTDAQAYPTSSPVPGTGNVDAGGAAMSTGNNINITSKVQERLTFCVYTGVSCNNGAVSVALGDTNGVLDPAGPYVDISTKYDVATNASQGVSVKVKGDTLKSGSFSISAIGGTAASSNPANEQFGFCTWEPATSGLTPVAPYNNASCNTTSQTAGTGTPGGAGSAQFAFNTANTTSTYGDEFVTKSAGTSSTGQVAFIGNISNTTEAGIYTTTLMFIATGTY